ncbi:hypothetical protein [Metabacillus sp. B2-18]|uniref:hypothetical protein n=1 Tax=Metabacillus sp. B2-18 TaxID=2897333 RepID=UPI001E55C948|nr:hypothetical protein [Metabacillus sp. B2-18]UGB33151.1 hypothetical protein LPC09_12345 [Metabacillus sp. B2-18]
MRYEYQPTSLKTWLRDNRNQVLSHVIEDPNTKYESDIETLIKKFESVKTAKVEEFVQWSEKLSRRQKLLVPNLYSDELNDEAKKGLIKIMQNNAATDKRTFRVLVDTVYQTCNLDEIWNVMKYSYVSHRDRIEKRFNNEQSIEWRDFLLSKDPVHHLAEKAYYSENDFLSVLESFYLTENFPLYKLVLMDVFNFADQDFFIKEKELYKKYFKEATNEEQQKMADGLIRNCQLNQVKDLGKLVFEKLKTYRRKPMLWKYVGEEEKKRFANWILKLEIKDFFGQVNKDHERFQYWEKFIVNLEDVVVTDGKSTLIMYFSDVVVIEVLGTGAVYIYKTSTFNKHFQPKVDKMLAEKERLDGSWIPPKEVKRSELMDKWEIVSGGWLRHVGDWQSKFDDWLSDELGWEVDRDALLQKEAERDEG